MDMELKGQKIIVTAGANDEEENTNTDADTGTGGKQGPVAPRSSADCSGCAIGARWPGSDNCPS